MVSVINSCLATGAVEINILDAGCGDGVLMALLSQLLPKLNDKLVVNIFGFDVCDSQVQGTGYFGKTIKLLTDEVPGINWEMRLRQIKSTDRWPYEGKFFDFVVSNQVLEHVSDHAFFFSEISRVLKDDGRGIHLFPLKDCWHEGHINVPFSHWITDRRIMYSYIYMASLLGMGKYRAHKRADVNLTRSQYCIRHTDYILFNTNYISHDELAIVAKRNGLAISFGFTHWLFINKLRSLLSFRLRYKMVNSSALTIFLFWIMKRITSVTLVMDKQNTYRQELTGHQVAPEKTG